MTYFDYAAATPVDEQVLAAMLPYFSEQFYNPSAAYPAARRVRHDVDAARAAIAGTLGARTPEVIFTAGGTEANNLAIHGVLRAFPGKKIVVSSIEHESVLAAARQYPCAQAPVNAQGVVDVAALAALIDDDTVLVSTMYANNEVGTVQPIREISRLVQHKRAGRSSGLPLYFHTDAAQAANYLDLHVARLGVDMLTLNGGKMYGPKQSGALWVRSGVTLEPLVYGGGQERGYRSGTENVAGAMGLAKALEIAQGMRRRESARLQSLQQLFFALLTEMIPGVIINGPRVRRLPNNIHVTLPGTDNERLLMQLDEAGIMAAAGSACSASDEAPSHVLRAMGIADREARASLRFTLGRATVEADVRQAVVMLAKLAGA